MTKINSVYPLHPIYAQALAEQHKIGLEREQLDSAFLASGSSDCRRLRRVLPIAVALRDRLARCYAREEEGGYLEEATIRRPRLSAQAHNLQRRRGEMLRVLQEFIAELPDCKSLQTWELLRNRYSKLSQSLREHEMEERDLLQLAFNEDTGIGN